MRILIAGAGAVGTHLAELLSKDNFNIILIDDDENKLGRLNSNLDIQTLCLSPTSISDLKEAEAGRADLFIAVTPDESTNLISCTLASQLGAKKTVARVDNYEYMLPENKSLFESMGISSLIYPELLASKEIAGSAKFSWVRQWWEFNEGELVLLSVKMHEDKRREDKTHENNQLVGKTLKEIGMSGHKFHVVAIRRNGETISAYGDERILPQDLVFFMTLKEEVDKIRHLSGKDDYPVIHHALIIGGGKLSVRADWALPKNISVNIIEADNNRAEELGKLVKDGTMITLGDGFDMELLKDESHGEGEAFIALTNNDEENILACVAARRRGARKTIAQVENIAYLDMAEDLDVGTIINKKLIAAAHIYKMLLKADVDNMKRLTVADAEVAEFVVKEGSKVTRKKIMDLGFPRGVNIGGVIRDGKGMLVHGMTQLKPGDKAVVFCVGARIQKLDKYFK